MVVLEAEGLGEELLHHALLVGLQQGFLPAQLLDPPIHRRQERRDLLLLGERGDCYLDCCKGALVDDWDGLFARKQTNLSRLLVEHAHKEIGVILSVRNNSVNLLVGCAFRTRLSNFSDG